LDVSNFVSFKRNLKKQDKISRVVNPNTYFVKKFT